MGRLSRIPVLAALIVVAGGCGDAVETNSTPTASVPRTSTSRPADTTTISSDASTTEPTPATSEVTTTQSAPVDPPEQTIYRPEPIREGDPVIAMIVPVDGIVLDDSSVALRIVELPDGRFLELDLTSAVVPEGTAFWTTEINGRTRGRSTARQGSTMGERIDRDVYGDTLIVTFSAITSDGTLLATTGEVQIVD